MYVLSLRVADRVSSQTFMQKAEGGSRPRLYFCCRDAASCINDSTNIGRWGAPKKIPSRRCPAGRCRRCYFRLRAKEYARAAKPPSPASTAVDGSGTWVVAKATSSLLSDLSENRLLKQLPIVKKKIAFLY